MEAHKYKPAAEALEHVLAKVVRYHPSPDLGLVRNAYEFAAQAHSGQMRKSGEPYITHPVGVADIVAALKLDELSLCAALLPDTVEDTEATIERSMHGLVRMLLRWSMGSPSSVRYISARKENSRPRASVNARRCRRTSVSCW